MYDYIHNEKYDFKNISYSKSYPNLHKYPATMLPQIGIAILKELNINGGRLLDPYCGSGSSFISAIESNIFDFEGYDCNPLAIFICKVKFTNINLEELNYELSNLENKVYSNKNSNDIEKYIPIYKNINYWYSQENKYKLAFLKKNIFEIKNEDIRNFILLAFLDTSRMLSYTRNNEFKLYRMKIEDIENFNIDANDYFFTKLNENINHYKNYYLKYSNKNIKSKFNQHSFFYKNNKSKFDVVLTSPPYGDSRTTVAYGQFSFFANMWLGNDYANKIDSILMGGKNKKEILDDSIISEQIYSIKNKDIKRAIEVSSFYMDLRESIENVAKSIKRGGYSIYVVGNRIVKDVYLNTDKFIAECFERENFKHIFTYKRFISNKRMPTKNSPTNIKGKLSNTMTEEFIVVSRF